MEMRQKYIDASEGWVDARRHAANAGSGVEDERRTLASLNGHT
jgi:hypothetical protein